MDEINRAGSGLVLVLGAHEDTRQMGELLSRWDYHDDPDKSAPTIFQAVYRKFALLVFEDELGEDLAVTMLCNWYFGQERLSKMVVEGNSAWFDNVKTAGIKESRDDLFHQSALTAVVDLDSRLGGNPVESFMNGNKVYWWFSDAAIKEHSRNALVLKP